MSAIYQQIRNIDSLSGSEISCDLYLQLRKNLQNSFAKIYQNIRSQK